MKKNMRILLLTACLLFVTAGCGKKANDVVQVTVRDGYTISSYLARKNSSVEEILREGEIPVRQGDQVTPSMEEEIDAEDVSITIERKATTRVVADDRKETVTMTGKKVKDALEELDIHMGEYDVVNHDPEAYLTDDMDIEVLRRYEVTLTADGKEEKKITEARTVRTFLADSGIKLGKDDRVSPDLKKALKNGTHVVVKRVRIKKEKKKEVISYDTTYENDSSMKAGNTRIKKNGVNGEKEITYQVTYVDGKEESRKEISSRVTREPVRQIVVRGTKKDKPKKHVISTKYKTDCDGKVYRIIKYSDGSTVKQRVE